VLDFFYCVAPELGMRFHDRPFFSIKRSRLEQNTVGNPNLAISCSGADWVRRSMYSVVNVDEKRGCSRSNSARSQTKFCVRSMCWPVSSSRVSARCASARNAANWVRSFSARRWATSFSSPCFDFAASRGFAWLPVGCERALQDRWFNRL